MSIFLQEHHISHIKLPLGRMWTINAGWLHIFFFSGALKVETMREKMRNFVYLVLLLFKREREEKNVENYIEMYEMKSKRWGSMWNFMLLCKVDLEIRMFLFNVYTVFFCILRKVCIHSDWISSCNHSYVLKWEGPVASAWLDLQSSWKSNDRI